MPCCAEVNDTGSTGLVSIASPVSTSRHAGFCIPIRRSASSRHDLRQEPYAVTLHVRICAGGGQQRPSLPRPYARRLGLQLILATPKERSELVAPHVERTLLIHKDPVSGMPEVFDFTKEFAGDERAALASTDAGAIEDPPVD